MNNYEFDVIRGSLARIEELLEEISKKAGETSGEE